MHLDNNPGGGSGYCYRGKGLQVVIVGAGAAGLYAGWLLQGEGASVTILEAGDQHGGRLRVLEGFSDFPIELGAAEIHGQYSVLYELIKTQGGNFADFNETELFYVDGQLRGEEVLEEDDFAAAEEFMDSLGDWQGEDITISERIADECLAARTDFLIEARIGNEYGAQNDRIGARSLALADEAWSSGHKDFLLCGTTLIEHLDKALASVLLHVKTGKLVTRIDYDSGGVTVSCSDGTSFDAAAVIIAVPITILRDGDIQFVPPLSAAKLAAIALVPMGAGMKIVLKFSTRFWKADVGSIYGAAHAPEFWATGLGRSNDNNALTAYVMGDTAETLSRLGHDAIPTLLADLDELFGNRVASRTYVDGVIMDWYKEATIRGAYSYPGPGSHAPRQILAERVGATVYFAGEATHTGGHFATVHGAMETGKRAANEMLNWWLEHHNPR